MKTKTHLPTQGIPGNARDWPPAGLLSSIGCCEEYVLEWHLDQIGGSGRAVSIV
ncbi:hypothetical protein COCON_G00222290 [Conger conger]|uniref:Uncharacterized protein n=1 Tax=Conger conger TaxID=82655 RepID=A0A9Q1HMP4_CONCO|nr:hypothetical protein COCON_G00222290 [Conger conger]